MLRTIDEETLRTLTAVSGHLARLAYLASLQQQPGEYHHWGLIREYGQDDVFAAFQRSHQLVFDTLLQTDISELLGEVLVEAEDRHESAAQYVDRLLARRFLTPRKFPKHVDIHFNWLCESLRALAHSHE